MKRFGFVFLIAFLFVACSKQELDFDHRSAGVDLSFDAFFSQEPFTRTCISSADPSDVLWSPFEKISLFYPDGYIYKSSCFVSENPDTASIVAFKGKIEREQVFGSIETGSEPSYEYYAVYPYNENNAIDGTDLIMDINPFQIASDATFSKNQFPSIAHTSDTRLCFYNVCGGFCFSLKNNYVKKVTFASNGDETLAGRARVAFSDSGLPEIKSFVSGQTSTVSLIAPDSTYFTPGVLYYIVLPPVSLSTGFTFTLYTQSAKAEVVKSNSVEVKRSLFGKYLEIDEDVEFQIKAQKVVLDTLTLNIPRDGSYQLNAEVLPVDASDKSVTWSSSADSIATVSDSGLIKAFKRGQCLIRATSNDDPSVYAECLVTVVRKADDVINLDEGGHYANCYIVSESGAYEFAPVKGIGPSALTGVNSVEVLWEYIGDRIKVSKGDLIDSLSLSNGRVRFVTPSVLQNGNALVAVKDSEGKILWSWHIWISDGFQPENEKVLCANGTYMMGRHIGGPTAAAPVELGMLYQWGRKDPFLACDYPNVFTSSTEWPSPVESTSQTGTVQYAVEHPMQFITANYRDDWYYPEDQLLKTRWTSSAKTDYDPCPYGWRVPSGGDSGFWVTAMVNPTASFKWGSYPASGADVKDIFGLQSSCWFQSTGYLSKTYSLIGISSLIQLWSSSYSTLPRSTKAYCMNILMGGNIGTNDACSCAVGNAVRCVLE